MCVHAARLLAALPSRPAARRRLSLCDGPGTEGCGACLGSAGGIGAVGFAGAGVVRALERRLPAAPGRQVRRAAEWGAALISSTERGAASGAPAHRSHAGGVRPGHALSGAVAVHPRPVRAFGVDPARITVAPNGVDHAPFVGLRRQSSVTTGSRSLRLGFLGSLMISKAPHLLLEAAARLASRLRVCRSVRRLLATITATTAIGNSSSRCSAAMAFGSTARFLTTRSPPRSRRSTSWSCRRSGRRTRHWSSRKRSLRGFRWSRPGSAASRRW